MPRMVEIDLKMTSESEFERVEITHFINPHLFWINRIEEIDTEYQLFYDRLQTYAQQSGTCPPLLKKIYAFKDPVKNIWARGVIELDIDLKVAQSLQHSKVHDKSYKVWLIDEGRPIDVSQLPRKLSREFREKETKCERCILFGVIPATTEINLSKEVCEKRRICYWQTSAKEIVKEILSKKNVQVYFKTRKYLENVVIGDLQVVLKNKLFNMAEYLVEKGLAFMDENNFFKVQRHIILSPTCRVKTPSETQSRSGSSYSQSLSNQSRPGSSHSRPLPSPSKSQKIISNSSSRSISVQSETIAKQFNQIITVDNTIADDLDDISDLVDSDPPIRAFTKRTSTESQVRHRKPIVSDSSSSENELIKLKYASQMHIKTSDNDSLILNRTAGRGSRRSIKLKQKNNSFNEESSEISESQNESFGFESDLISFGRGTRKHLKSPENSLSARKKLFNSKDKLISNTSGKTPAKKLFTDIASINAIDHTLSMNQDAEFYDNTDSELTSSEDNGSSKNTKKGVKYITNKHGGADVKNCIAVIKNIDEIQPSENRIVEEEILVGMAQPEDDALFLQRFNQKKAQKLENEKLFSEQLTKINQKPLEQETKENISPDQTTTRKPYISKLLKKLKIKQSSSETTNDSTSSSSPPMITSSNLDSSSTSHYESTTSSNDYTDNETLDKAKQMSANNNSTLNWSKVGVTVDNRKLNLMPAGAPVEQLSKKKDSPNHRQMPKKTRSQDIEETEDTITTDLFLEKQVKTFRTGRNIKTAASMSTVLNVGGLNSNHFLIHSFKKITPIQNVGQAYLHSDIRNVLTSLNIIELNNLQTYVWPAVNRGENVIAIWPKYKNNKPDENSCMMYLPILCNTIIENSYDDLEKFNGPIVLILCAHKTAARIVYEKILLLLSLVIKREKFEYAQKLKNKPPSERIHFNSRAYLLLDKVDIIRGDIVISTPKCFMNRLNQMRGYATEFRRLCHLVIDDADIITDRYYTELSEILSQCQSTLDRRRNSARNIQLILTGQKWTNGVEELCKKSQIKPAICIESPIEAAIYAKVNMNIQFIKNDTKIEALYELINQKTSTFKTLLMCNKYNEIEQVVNFLNTKGIEALSVKKHYTGTEIKHIFDQWNTAPPGAYTLLVLSDDTLADICVTSAMWLIHYTLPRTWTHFSNRFNALSANYSSFYTTSKKAVANPKAHIFIDESHIEVIPRMINFLERLSNNTNFTKLLPLKEAAIIAKEEKKLKTSNTELCYLLLSTGICPNEFACKNRHLLASNIDAPKFANIKIGSSIKLKFIKQYDGGVHYAARLIDSENDYKMLAMDLVNYYRENRIVKLTTIETEKMYAYKKSETLFERCKIIEKASRRHSSSPKDYYKILLIDTGEMKTVKVTDLLDLPECFTKDMMEQEALALEVFIANVKPCHNEIIWDIENKAKLDKILSDINIYNPDIFITCDVQLTIGNCIWIDNVQIIEHFPHSGTNLERLNLTYELERAQIIEKNPIHLKNLLELCKRANIDLKYEPYNKSIETTKKHVKKSAIKIQNAFLNVGSMNFEKVFFLSTADVGSIFYLGRYDFNVLLTHLLDEILQTATNGFYPKEFDIRENDYCLVWMSEVEMYYRAQIHQILPNQQVKCFLIDEGYDEIFNKNDLKPIRDWMLSKLPAQSIPCRLFGVQYNSLILEQFEDMYDTLWAKCVQRDPDGTHAVLLIQNFNGNNLIINNTALADSDSRPITSEVFQDDDLILQEIDEINSDDDEDITDYIDTANHNNTDNILDLVNIDDDKEIHSFEDDDVCIHNPEEFFKGLLHFEGPPINNYRNQLEKKNNHKSDDDDEDRTPIDDYSNKIIDPQNEEIVSSGLLPTVLWHQTDNTIVLKIQLVDIKDYELFITKNSLLFRADYNGKFYELNLSLYENIDDTNYSDQAKGMEIVIKLIKLIKGSKWPRLLKSQQRFRNIKLNVEMALSDDETDDKKIVPFLQEFSQLEDDETDEDELRYELGSDDDGDSSDWDDEEQHVRDS